MTTIIQSDAPPYRVSDAVIAVIFVAVVISLFMGVL